jgi:6-pyruvoyltetrahydropterin/6-carboxytetrahydropterin synthase
VLSEIYLEMTFDAGHRIVGHKGKCARLHGHTYRAEIRAAGPVREPGFVVDFGDIKDVVNEWDHRLLLWGEDPSLIQWVGTRRGFPPDRTHWGEDLLGVIRVPFNPTAENMAEYLAKRLSEEFGLMEVQVTLWETPKGNATYIVSKDSVPL